ncbi:unnamed protein product [Peronospora destructor]|uniref:Uncharacterized protein n=1 Tax=Peronospora destructor TaxID=86335 RepID=A0AAV0ULW3_9STRA|nr:unnamed protein product [Peronospora destructor]
MHTYLVLTLATLSSSCFNLAEGNPIPPTGLITTIEQALQHGDDVLLKQVFVHFASIEKTGFARKMQVEEVEKKFREEISKLENMGDGLTKEELNAYLEKYVKNIKEDPWFKTPDGKKYEELAEKTTEKSATDPSKPSKLMSLFQKLLVGAVALLVFVGILKLAT